MFGTTFLQRFHSLFYHGMTMANPLLVVGSADGAL